LEKLKPSFISKRFYEVYSSMTLEDIKLLIANTPKSMLVDFAVDFILRALDMVHDDDQPSFLNLSSAKPNLNVVATNTVETTQPRRFASEIEQRTEQHIPYPALTAQIHRNYPYNTSHGAIQGALDQCAADIKAGRPCEPFTRYDLAKWRRAGLAPAAVLSYVSRMPTFPKRTYKKKTNLTLAIG
jgi:hypothetical protein